MELDNRYIDRSKEQFQNEGYCSLEKFIGQKEVDKLIILYDRILSDKSLFGGLRNDLSGKTLPGQVEKITQIMLPSRIIPELGESEVYAKARKYAMYFLGDDISLDFDMLINKLPHTDTETPWHQDAAYWMDMPDKRAVSCWIALDKVHENNGCMWFAPVDNDRLYQHKQMPNGGALHSLEVPDDPISVPLPPGGCTFHDGYTLHYSRGNTTDSQRRALILNFRPTRMIELERASGVDHTGEIKL